jgi:cytosine/adenosine deaminase-related metal-dependent hydrolase
MRHGVVAVGDIDGTQGAGTAGRRRAGLGGRSFLEIVGVHKAGARARLAACLALIDRLGTGTDELGLSPHAPYSVHADVLPEIVRAATARGLPLAMHLAESPEETRYLTHGDGPFVGFLERIGKGPPFPSAPGVRPIAYAERAGFLAAGGLVIHGNDLADEDIDALSRHQASVVYCHGTHAHFDRPAHRIADLLQAGVNVALGTDSAASNPRLDLFDELQRLTLDRPDLDPKALLAAATLGGRRALGLPPGVAVWERETTADGLLIGPAPEDLGRMSPAALAEWALSGQPQPLITVRGGLIRPLEPISAQLDSWIGQG